MRRAGYSVVPHTAEVGLRIEGRTWRVFFSNAAQGIVSLYGASGKGRQRSLIVKLEADSAEELLVRWLNEIIFVISTKRWVPDSFCVLSADRKSLKASMSGKDLHSGTALATEIKAATYHMLNVRRFRGRWTTTVILDV